MKHLEQIQSTNDQTKSVIQNFNEKKEEHNGAVRLLFMDFKEST